MLALLMTLLVPAASAAEPGDTVTYTADLSNGLPSDWGLFEGSDVNHSTAGAGENGVTLAHANTSIGVSLYYGAVYEVATDLGNVSDFDLSMTFRFLSYDNESRWICLYYHTQKTEDGMEGYLMNLRVNGNSAQSTVTDTPSYTDTTNVATGAQPSDGKEHTIRVVCKDGQVEHYMDGNLVYSYNLSDKYGVLGGVWNEGGFAIGVNRSKVEITSLTITATKGEENSVKSTLDELLADTYIPQTRLVSAPAVVTEIDSREKLEALSGDVIPQVAVFRVNDELNVVDADGNSLGYIDEVITTQLREKIVPVVYVQTDTQAGKFITWLQKVNILDIAVASDDPALVKRVRAACQNIRGILDCSTGDWELAQIVAQSNESCASVVVIGEDQASTDNVAWLQARLKTVWVKTDAATEFAVADIVGSGAYGIWIDDYALAYDTYMNYTDSNALARVPFDIAHRGLALSSYENTVEGCLAAYEAGATHVEVDLRLTSDGKLVVMHDDDISRTTNGSGSVSSMTLEQLRQYKVTKNYNGEVLGDGVAIPTLDEVFDALEDKDIVLILELKSSDLELVSKLAEALEARPEMVEQIIVITFYVDQLEAMQEQLPQVPTANLNSFTYTAFTNGMITSSNYNTVPNTGYGNLNSYFMSNDMLVRGYMAWCWTFGSISEVANYFASGVLGMTTNVPDQVGTALAVSVSTESGYAILKGTETEVDAIITNYDGSQTQVQASIFMQEEREDGTWVILKYRFTEETGTLSYTIYSRQMRAISAGVYLSPEKIVEELNNLPEELTLDNQQKVQKLRAALDALDEEDQALVTNSSKLTGAERSLSRLSQQTEDDIQQPDDTQPGDSSQSVSAGMQSYIIIAAVVLAVLVAVMVLLLKRKK